MNRKMRELMARTRKKDRTPAPVFEAKYAVQIRVKLNQALTMEQAEEDTAAILRSLPVTFGIEVIESEVYEY